MVLVYKQYVIFHVHLIDWFSEYWRRYYCSYSSTSMHEYSYSECVCVSVYMVYVEMYISHLNTTHNFPNSQFHDLSLCKNPVAHISCSKVVISTPPLIQIWLCVCPQVYAVGGYDGQSRLSSVECYDCFSNRWTEVAHMKEAVSSPAVASCAGKLFVIGGGPDDDTCSDKVGSRCVLP